ncbi:sigma-54 interaction domain-containing protein [Azotosporobacter soli]|uniref:sigma-54 interaction domain-containing protein n=1 Tax=Azotosporobacter soli TaxID=3055040 RepID=UPI0031FE8C5F
MMQTPLRISFEQVLENINEAICVVDKDAVVTYINKSFEATYGIKRGEIVGKTVHTFFPNALCLKVLQQRKAVEYVEHRPREGNVVMISSIPIYENDALIGAVSIDQDITEIRRISNELEEAKNRIKYLEYAEEIIQTIHGKSGFQKVLYKSKLMYDLIMLAQRVAESDASVMIVGESGTGKDLFAQAIHGESMRKERPFVVVDCSSIPAMLMESELFGYEAGAFTGANKKGKQGKFEIANGGTIFLDEIGELPLEMQSKLLRVLESQEFYRVGGVKPIKVDVRVIAATNRALVSMLSQGTFRKDLYYRLNVFTLKIPALRERPDDIPLLIDFYLKRYSVLNNRIIDRIDPEVTAILRHYHWPGNVRELKNVMERLVVLADGNSISAKQLPMVLENLQRLEDGEKPELAAQFKTLLKLEETLFAAEQQAIMRALEAAGNNKAKAAKILDIPRSTLYYKLQKMETKKSNA